MSTRSKALLRKVGMYRAEKEIKGASNTPSSF